MHDEVRDGCSALDTVLRRSADFFSLTTHDSSNDQPSSPRLFCLYSVTTIAPQLLPKMAESKDRKDPPFAADAQAQFEGYSSNLSSMVLEFLHYGRLTLAIVR